MLQVNNLNFFLSDSVPVFSPSMQHRHYSNRAKHKHYSISGDEQLNKKSTTKFHMGVKYKKNHTSILASHNYPVMIRKLLEFTVWKLNQ